ncbi:MAG: hypothetical protein JNL14_18040 [Devosia sp.]|uniref:hypothetical protein n=1 Tax=Devosia sp. TaxID=1871048 RepID=UPI001A5BCC2E|nr:hypothetical protein [Devosia sp.]MBL8599640.1 hypothetical protein [Devosia sp.]
MRSLILVASLLLATPALATEWVYCGDAADEASVGLLLGGVEFVNISAVTLRAGTAEWASAEVYGPGAPIAVAQTYMGDDQLVVDLTDDNYNDVLAQLRVYTSEEGEDYVQGGVLRVPGHGAWVVTCEGP